MDKHYWVFDLDGTLTLPVHDFVHIRNELGIPQDQDILETINSYDALRKHKVLQQLDTLESYYASLAQPAPGAIELVGMLGDKGCRLGILTRNTKSLARLSLDAIGVGGYFDTQDILGRDEALPKPSPEGIHFLLNQWKGQPSRAVMVGDYHFDLLAGRSASVITVHVDSSERHWPEDTDVRVNSLHDLRKLIV